MPDYTESDLKALADLMVFNDAAAASSPPAQGGRIASSISYARADIDQFDQLMNFATSAGQAPHRPDYYQASRPAGSQMDPVPDDVTYAQSDLRLFDRLLPPIYGNSNSVKAREFNIKSAAEELTGQSYSTQDLEAFQRLMQFASDKAGEPIAVSTAQPDSTYMQPKFRDQPARVKTMKIVDADTERDRERRNFLSGRAAIKIVFSDADGGMP